MGEPDDPEERKLRVEDLEQQLDHVEKENERLVTQTQQLRRQFQAKERELEREQREVKRLQGQLADMELIKNQNKRLRTFEEAAAEAEKLKLRIAQLELKAQKSADEADLLRSQSSRSLLPSKSEKGDEEHDTSSKVELDFDVEEAYQACQDIVVKLSDDGVSVDDSFREQIVQMLNKYNAMVPVHTEALKEAAALRAELKEMHDHILNPHFRPAPSVFSEREAKHKQDELQWKAKLKQMENEIGRLKDQVHTLRHNTQLDTIEEKVQELRKRVSEVEGERDAARHEAHELHIDLQELKLRLDQADAAPARPRRRPPPPPSVSATASTATRTTRAPSPINAPSSLSRASSGGDDGPRNIGEMIDRFNAQGIGRVVLDQIFDAYAAGGASPTTGSIPIPDGTADNAEIVQSIPAFGDVVSWLQEQNISPEDIDAHLKRSRAQHHGQTGSAVVTGDVIRSGDVAPNVFSEGGRVREVYKQLEAEGVGPGDLQGYLAVLGRGGNVEDARHVFAEATNTSGEAFDEEKFAQVAAMFNKEGISYQDAMALSSNYKQAQGHATPFDKPVDASWRSGGTVTSTINNFADTLALFRGQGMPVTHIATILQHYSQGGIAALDDLPEDIRSSPHFGDLVARLQGGGLPQAAVGDILAVAQHISPPHGDAVSMTDTTSMHNFADTLALFRGQGMPVTHLASVLQQYSQGGIAALDDLPEDMRSSPHFGDLVARLQGGGLPQAAVGDILAVAQHISPPREDAMSITETAHKFAELLAFFQGKGVTDDQMSRVLEHYANGGVVSGADVPEELRSTPFFSDIISWLDGRGLQPGAVAGLLAVRNAVGRLNNAGAFLTQSNGTATARNFAEALDRFRGLGVPEDELAVILHHFSRGRLAVDDDEIGSVARSSAYYGDVVKYLDDHGFESGAVADLMVMAECFPRARMQGSVADNLHALGDTLDSLAAEGVAQRTLGDIVSAYAADTLDQLPEELQSSPEMVQVTAKLEAGALTPQVVSDALALAKHVSQPTAAPQAAPRARAGDPQTPGIAHQARSLSELLEDLREMGAPESHLQLILTHYATDSLSDTENLPAEIRSLPKLQEVETRLHQIGLTPSTVADLLLMAECMPQPESADQDQHSANSLTRFTNSLVELQANGVPQEVLVAVLRHYSLGSGVTFLPPEVYSSPYCTKVLAQLEGEGKLLGAVADFISDAGPPEEQPRRIQAHQSAVLQTNFAQLGKIISSFFANGVPGDALRCILEYYTGKREREDMDAFVESFPHLPQFIKQLDDEGVSPRLVQDFLAAVDVLVPPPPPPPPHVEPQPETVYTTSSKGVESMETQEEGSQGDTPTISSKGVESVETQEEGSQGATLLGDKQPPESVPHPAVQLRRALEEVYGQDLSAEEIRQCVVEYLEYVAPGSTTTATGNGGLQVRAGGAAGRPTSVGGHRKSSLRPSTASSFDSQPNTPFGEGGDHILPWEETLPEPSALVSDIIEKGEERNKSLTTRMDNVRIKLSMLLMTKEEVDNQTLLELLDDVSEQLGVIDNDVVRVTEDHAEIMRQFVFKTMQLAEAAEEVTKMRRALKRSLDKQSLLSQQLDELKTTTMAAGGGGGNRSPSTQTATARKNNSWMGRK